MSNEAVISASRVLVSPGGGRVAAQAEGAAAGLSARTGTTTAGGSTTGSASATLSGAAPPGAVGTAAGASTGGARVATSASTSGSGPSAAAAAACSTIPLGNVGTYSGVIGAIETGAQQALQVWAAYMNAHGGLNCHPVKVISADDGGDPSTDQTEVEEMVTEDHVLAFVGNLVPLTADASLAYLQQQGIPAIGGDETSQYWYQSPILFPQGGFLESAAVGGFKAAEDEGDNKLGFLYCVEDPVCSQGYQEFYQGGLAQQFGMDPVYASSFSLTQPDFTAQCISAKQAGANIVLLGGDGNSLERLARDCAAQGYDPVYEALSIGVSSSMQGDDQLNGMISGQQTFPWMDNETPAQAAYQSAIRMYAPSLQSSGASAGEWTSGMLAVAADKYLGTNPTTGEFLQGLWSIKNNDLGGLSVPLTFNQNAPASTDTCYFLITMKNGVFVDPNNGNYQCT
jgi:branched-chain amino acid transport system substrate-binding protein